MVFLGIRIDTLKIVIEKWHFVRNYKTYFKFF